ncbi:hypothetical protein [Neptuniibacter sp. QD37_11]|uniref:hypothetical protein n=1 Tax=Neptuniibacter sp. QD37_11 TaxID=3398209 RepID=UPI0039F4514B
MSTASYIPCPEVTQILQKLDYKVDSLKGHHTHAVLSAAIKMGDDTYFKAYKDLRRIRPDLRADIQEFFDDVVFFFEDSECGPLALRAKGRIKIISKQNILEDVITLTGGEFLGFEMKRPNSEQWAFVLPDASEPGRYRYSEFDADGFYGHQTRDTPEECLKDMIMEGGYTHPDKGALNKVQATPRFIEGVIRLAERQRQHSLENEEEGPSI